MKKYNYSQYRITCPQDVNELESIIRQHGSFSKRDYERCVRQANRTDMSSRIILRLRKLIRPLIQKEYESSTPICSAPSLSIDTGVREQKEVTTLNDVYSKSYKASDFEIKKGVIILGNLRLNSVRIQAYKSKWLDNITHEFTIAPEPNAKGQFHFVPYTDLSVLLKLADENKQAKIRLEKEKRQKELQESFLEQLPHVFSQYFAYSEQKDYYPALDVDHIHAYNILSKAKLVQEGFSYSDYTALAKEKCHYVEFCDLDISDGEVAFKTEKIDLCWNLSDFYQYLWDKYSRVDLESLIPIISEKFAEALESKRKEIGNFEWLRIHTHLTKSAFYDWFVKNPQMEWHIKSGSALGNIPTCFRFPASFVSERPNDGMFLFTRIPAGNLFNLLTSECYEVTKDCKDHQKAIVDTFTDDEKQKPYIQQILKDSVEFRLIQPFHYDMLDIPFFLYSPNIVLRFRENYAHISDGVDYNYGDGYGKSTEYSYCYLLINKEEGFIVLYPENRKYAPYRFELKDDAVCITAAYAIAAYFSTNIANKRQNFKFPCELYRFGISYYNRL